MVFRLRGGFRENGLRETRAGPISWGALSLRRNLQGRLVPSIKDEAGPENLPGQPSPLNGGESKLRDFRVAEGWVGPIRKIRRRGQAVRATTRHYFRKLPSGHGFSVFRQMEHPPFAVQRKDYIDPDNSDDIPPPQIVWDDLYCEYVVVE